MSLVTLSTLERITAQKLAEMVLASSDPNPGPGSGSGSGSGPESHQSSLLAIVDVRDDDYIGGHIRSSLHFPSRSLDATMPTMLRKLEGKDTVVFHCALSQQRGPGAALRYLREREAQGRATSSSAANLDKASSEEKEGRKQKQKVYVLDRGFVGWQEVYGPDERLTEGYRKELWEDY